MSDSSALHALIGRSLGDRCLTLARELGATVVTAGRPWKQLKGFCFEVVR
jgi:PIN domain nuclease of toxin-antitoxin system